MIIFARTPPTDSSWRRQLVAALPGLLVGMGLAVALRWTTLTPAARVLISSLPMWFLFTLLNPVGRSRASFGRRVRRAALYAVAVSTILYGVVLVA